MLSRIVVCSSVRLIALFVMALGLAHVPLDAAAGDIRDTLEESENGLVDDETWVSPQFGTEAEWNADWSAIVPETFSDPDDGLDQLRLGWEEGRGSIYVQQTEEGRGGPPEDVAFWTSDEFLVDEPYAHVDEFEVLLEEPGASDDDGAVLIGLADAGDPTAWLRYAQSVPTDGGGALHLVLVAPVEAWPGILESAQDSLTIDGDAAFDVFNNDDVEDAVAEAPSVEFDAEAAGMVDDDTFVGPAFGYEVTWPESWALNEVVRNPVVSKAVVSADEVHIAETGTDAVPPPFFDFYAYYTSHTTAEHELSVFVDPDWVSLGFREEVEITVLLQDSGEVEAEALVAVTFPETGEVEYAWFRWTRYQDESELYFYLKARSEDFHDAWEVLTGEIALNGDALEVMFTWDDVEEAIADFEG